MASRKDIKKIRYAVVGLGHIAQVAVLPAFAKAQKNSELAALVTGDPKKSRKISAKYGISEVYGYDQYHELLDSGKIDAVYICLPNHLHREYAQPALEKGIHVLCEKPLALNAEDCIELHRVATHTETLAMTAYRLHFEESNLKMAQMVRSGKIGIPRYFSSEFSYQLKDKSNIRAQHHTGGGPVWDIGIYCINAARMIFGSEPLRVFAQAATLEEDERFKEVDEMVSVLMVFPEQKLAQFTCSFGADSASTYKVVGTKGTLTLENAFEYATSRKIELKKDKKRIQTFSFKKVDQFAAEVEYFSRCIQTQKNPEPNIIEGLIDVQIIQAIHESIENSKPIDIEYAVQVDSIARPEPKMGKHLAANIEPKVIQASRPSK